MSLTATMRFQASGLLSAPERRAHHLEGAIEEAKIEIQRVSALIDINERVIRSGQGAQDEFLDDDLESLNEDHRHQRKRLEIHERQLKSLRYRMAERARETEGIA